jgi:hypothetical protein
LPTTIRQKCRRTQARMPPPVLLLHMQIELLAMDDGGVARAHRNHQARSDGLNLMSLALKRHRRRLCLKNDRFSTDQEGS